MNRKAAKIIPKIDEPLILKEVQWTILRSFLARNCHKNFLNYVLAKSPIHRQNRKSYLDSTGFSFLCKGRIGHILFDGQSEIWQLTEDAPLCAGISLL